VYTSTIVCSSNALSFHAKEGSCAAQPIGPQRDDQVVSILRSPGPVSAKAIAAGRQRGAIALARETVTPSASPA